MTPATRRPCAYTTENRIPPSYSAKRQLGWTHSQRAGILVPDLLIAFGIDRDAIVDQRGYAIDEWGQPPDFVLEVASNATGRNDYTTKRAGYAEYGVPEYWRFDHTGGRLYPVGPGRRPAGERGLRTHRHRSG